MLSTPLLSDVLAGITSVPIRGVHFRAVHNHWLHNLPAGLMPEPLYAKASSVYGARFTPLGGPEMLYPETAYAEGNAIGKLVTNSDPLIAVPKPPTTLFSIDVQADSILDLTDKNILTELATTRNELRKPWRLAQSRALRGLGGIPATQVLGAEAFSSGRFHGIRYESGQLPRHKCLVLFTARLITPAFVEVHDPTRFYAQRIP